MKITERQKCPTGADGLKAQPSSINLQLRKTILLSVDSSEELGLQWFPQ